MSKIIDITDKLNFEEKPIFKIRDTEIRVNNDAVTMLKVAALMEGDGDTFTIGNMLDVFELIFDEENRRKVNALQLTMDEFSTAIMEIVKSLISNGSDDEGEAPTPATT